jgi:hypothetical protein
MGARAVLADRGSITPAKTGSGGNRKGRDHVRDRPATATGSFSACSDAPRGRAGKTCQAQTRSGRGRGRWGECSANTTARRGGGGDPYHCLSLGRSERPTHA